MASTVEAVPVHRKVGIGLGIGIFFLPIVFAWFTLRAGHTTRARAISFVWLVLSVALIAAPRNGPRPPLMAPPPTNTASTATVGTPDKPDTRVTAEKYNRLTTGMTYARAVEIMGSDGEELSTSDLAGYRTTMVAWKNWDGSNMSVTFQNGRLVMKAQFGLR